MTVFHHAEGCRLIGAPADTLARVQSTIARNTWAWPYRVVWDWHAYKREQTKLEHAELFDAPGFHIASVGGHDDGAVIAKLCTDAIHFARIHSHTAAHHAVMLVVPRASDIVETVRQLQAAGVSVLVSTAEAADASLGTNFILVGRWTNIIIDGTLSLSEPNKPPPPTSATSATTHNDDNSHGGIARTNNQADGSCALANDVDWLASL